MQLLSPNWQRLGGTVGARVCSSTCSMKQYKPNSNPRQCKATRNTMHGMVLRTGAVQVLFIKVLRAVTNALHNRQARMNATRKWMFFYFKCHRVIGVDVLTILLTILLAPMTSVYASLPQS